MEIIRTITILIIIKTTTEMIIRSILKILTKIRLMRTIKYLIIIKVIKKTIIQIIIIIMTKTIMTITPDSTINIVKIIINTMDPIIGHIKTKPIKKIMLEITTPIIIDLKTKVMIKIPSRMIEINLIILKVFTQKIMKITKEQNSTHPIKNPHITNFPHIMIKKSIIKGIKTTIRTGLRIIKKLPIIKNLNRTTNTNIILKGNQKKRLLQKWRKK